MSSVPTTLRAVRERAITSNAVYATLAYTGLSLAGALLLWLSAMQSGARGRPLDFLDSLFLATSAVSTTGLVTVDPGTTFNFAGELVILLLIQIGGLGYMTFASFAFITIRDRLSPSHSELTRAGFGLNDEYSVVRFVRVVVVSALLIECVGAVLLAIAFTNAGAENPIWSGIFHSVSAFCTAGFSLYATSLEGFRGDIPVLMTVAVLSYLGAMGFVVIAEVLDWLTRPRSRISPTTHLIIWVTVGMGLGGTLFLFFFEPSIAALPGDDRVLNAFFQAMSASTTVGFNSMPVGSIAPATVLVLYLLMFVGASPSGTGGGLKSTTAALLVATVIAAITDRRDVTTAGVRVPERRVRQATATLIVGLLIVFLAVTLLDLTGRYPFEAALFEVFSALGTVGLSMGITSQLNDVGKLIIITVMLVGRIGMLLFFIAFAHRLARDTELPNRERDVIL